MRGWKKGVRSLHLPLSLSLSLLIGRIGVIFICTVEYAYYEMQGTEKLIRYMLVLL